MFTPSPLSPFFSSPVTVSLHSVTIPQSHIPAITVFLMLNPAYSVTVMVMPALLTSYGGEAYQVVTEGMETLSADDLYWVSLAVKRLLEAGYTFSFGVYPGRVAGVISYQRMMEYGGEGDGE